MFDKLRFLAERKAYIKAIESAGQSFKIRGLNEIKDFQVSRFNLIWADAIANIPFYRKWKEAHSLPDRIESIEELSKWPILTKKEIMAIPKDLLRNENPAGYAITSGSTGVPLHIPVRNGTAPKQNMVIGRIANGLPAGLPTFLIWGHHQFYGKGIKRLVKITVRSLKDFFLGYLRISAYDTSVGQMHKAFNKYQRYCPSFVVGYSSSILSFVRANAGKKNVHSPKLVLCTAGPLSESQKDEIRKFFNAPLCMEYGSVECGVMAYTIDDCKCYKVFWNTHILQGEKTDDGCVRNIVTIITDRYFPLIRYDIGDCLNVPPGEDLSDILTIDEISGRPTDNVTLKSGASFFPMVIEAAVEHTEGVVGHQLVINDGNLEILVVATRKLTGEDLDKILNDLSAIIHEFKTSPPTIRQVDQLLKNKGGKTPIVYRY